ncbi:MAG: DUF6249 domain-containing protein [Acidobacteriota bacterium]|jgi:hypothetical protein|nr:DUF6249 domain-containing protein [Acidobacteriota bacterium]|tara:strand:+ start:15 stop:398 length:384 start_codon:yes stop_codon:yes gene_type:complete
MVVPILGMLTGIIIPSIVFIWLYFEGKGKRETILEIAKHLEDPSKVEELMGILEERKKEPIDYRRSGVITVFVGIGIYLLGFASLGSFFEGIGLLVGAIGSGTLIAGYLYPNTSEELTNAVEKFEEN